MIVRGSLCKIVTKEFHGRKKDHIGLFKAPGFLADIEEELDADPDENVAKSVPARSGLPPPPREIAKVKKLRDRCIGKIQDTEMISVIDIAVDERDMKVYYKVLTSRSQRIGWCRNAAVEFVSNPMETIE